MNTYEAFQAGQKRLAERRHREQLAAALRQRQEEERLDNLYWEAAGVAAEKFPELAELLAGPRTPESEPGTHLSQLHLRPPTGGGLVVTVEKEVYGNEVRHRVTLNVASPRLHDGELYWSSPYTQEADPCVALALAAERQAEAEQLQERSRGQAHAEALARYESAPRPTPGEALLAALQRFIAFQMPETE
jgi:hypothetical protein